jgi:phage-related protein
MKPIVFLGDSRERIRDFPERAWRRAGMELRQVQFGLAPSDWKPMTSVGPGVREIRVRDARGAFRVVYVAAFAEARLSEKDTCHITSRSGIGRPQACPIEVRTE